MEAPQRGSGTVPPDRRPARCRHTGVGLAVWLRGNGRPDEALAHYEMSIEAFVEVGDKNGESVARSGAASIWLGRNDTATAGRYLAEAFLIAVRLDDPHRVAKTRRRIATLRTQQGRHDQAVRQLTAAVAGFDSIGDDYCAAITRPDLGRALIHLGEEDAARRVLLDAIEIGHRIGETLVVDQATVSLGQLHG